MSAEYATLDEQSDSVVLVGHSIDGETIPQVAERPDAVDRTVYLRGFMLPNGAKLINPRSKVSLNPLKFVVPVERDVGYVSDGAVVEVFYAGCSPSYLALVRPPTPAGAAGPDNYAIRLLRRAIRGFSRTYVKCTDERAPWHNSLSSSQRWTVRRWRHSRRTTHRFSPRRERLPTLSVRSSTWRDELGFPLPAAAGGEGSKEFWCMHAINRQ